MTEERVAYHAGGSLRLALVGLGSRRSGMPSGWKLIFGGNCVAGNWPRPGNWRGDTPGGHYRAS